MKGKSHSDPVRRHCMVVHAYYPLGETRVEREALALVDRGYEVDVLCLRDANERQAESIDGVQIYRLPVKRYKTRGRAFQLLEYLAFFTLVVAKLLVLQPKRRYGVVQVHNLPDFLVFAAIPSKLAGARILLDLHDLMPEFFASFGDGQMTGWPVRLVILQEQLSCRFADHVITVTEVWRNTLIDRGVPPEKVAVVMNVADSRIFCRDAATPMTRQNGDAFKLIYHGTFTRRYGVDLIVHALDKVRCDIPEVELTLVGAGELRDELQGMIEERDLQDHVFLSQGLVSAAELPPLIRQAHVGIVPNRSDIFTDGLLPTKLMEYVALGAPVIAAHTPTIAAYFDASMIQFFAPDDPDALADAILTLHGDRARLACIAQNSDKFNRQFSWRQIAADYVDLVDRLNFQQGV